MRNHLRNRHPTGEAAKRYDVLQKLAYLGLIGLVFGMVATGLTMSPGIDAAAPWLLDLFGGRQSARTLHFVFAEPHYALFILVHVTEVVLAGPINELRSIDHRPLRRGARSKPKRSVAEMALITRRQGAGRRSRRIAGLLLAGCSQTDPR